LIFKISQNLLYLFGRFENGLNVVLIQYPAIDAICCSFYIWENGKGFFASHLVMVVCWDCLTDVFADYFIYIFFIRSFVRLVSDG